MFGINPSEFIVLVVVAAVVLGPERLPEYAQQLARVVRELRRMAQGASAQVRDELGPEFDDIDWRKLDPRQYDPRRIVREALADVWDPEDPLGLKEGNRPRRTDDNSGYDAPAYDSGYDDTPATGGKPHSAGGPTDVVTSRSAIGQDDDPLGPDLAATSSSTSGSAPTLTSAPTVSSAPSPAVFFDPDAT